MEFGRKFSCVIRIQVLGHQLFRQYQMNEILIDRYPSLNPIAFSNIAIAKVRKLVKWPSLYNSKLSFFFIINFGHNLHSFKYIFLLRSRRSEDSIFHYGSKFSRLFFAGGLNFFFYMVSFLVVASIGVLFLITHCS